MKQFYVYEQEEDSYDKMHRHVYDIVHCIQMILSAIVGVAGLMLFMWTVIKFLLWIGCVSGVLM